MSGLTVLFAILFYVAGATLIVGVGFKVWRYASIPAPLKIPTTPAPTTRAGVVWRLFKEVVFFTSLFKANKWTWIFGWVFHAGLLVVLMGHLRFFFDPLWGWIGTFQSLGPYAALSLMVGLVGLLLRRILVHRVRYISAPSDHLMLVLLLAIGVSGFLMRTVTPTDIVALKTFVLGLMVFDWQPLPADGVLITHLSFVVVLMLVFPFSKLLHAPGVFFSPTRNQVDNPRERRHLAPWAAALESKSDSGVL